MREFRSVQAWRSSRKLINARVRGAVLVLGLRFKRKRTWRSWHHHLESIRHDLEWLCSDNDSRWHMHKIKIISLDWVTLLRRLLILYKDLLRLYFRTMGRYMPTSICMDWRRHRVRIAKKKKNQNICKSIWSTSIVYFEGRSSSSLSDTPLYWLTCLCRKSPH